MTQKKLLLLYAYLTIVGLAGCKHSHDSEIPKSPKGTLSVEVNALSAPATPFSLFIYPTEGNLSPIREEIQSSLEKVLPQGKYHLAALGYNPAEIELKGTESSQTITFSLVSPDGTSVPSLSQGVYSAFQKDICIYQDETTPVELTPRYLFHTLELKVNAGNGFEHASLRGSLSGIASSVNGITGKATEGSGKNAVFHLLPTDTPGVFSATVGFLGIEGKENLLTLSLSMEEGEEYISQHDLTTVLREGLTQGNEPIKAELNPTFRIPIRLYTSIETRAAVDAFEGHPVGVAAGKTPGKYTELWEGVANGNIIKLEPERYYPTDGSSLYLVGFYPPAPLVNGQVEYTFTGQEDLMLTTEQSGSLTNRFHQEKTPLTYKHLLSYLTFDLHVESKKKNFAVRQVTLSGLAQKVTVSLTKGEAIFLNPSQKVMIYNAGEDGLLPIEDGKVSLPGYIFVQPQAQLTLNLILAVDDNPANDKVFSNLPVTFSGEGSEGGTAYQIVIEVDPDKPDNPDIPELPSSATVTATVTPWPKGNDGNASIEDNLFPNK